MVGEAGASDHAAGRAVPFTTGAQIGRWLRGLRLQAGLTQTQLSERTGVSQRYVSELERGRTDLTISRLLLLAGELGATISGTGPPDTPDAGGGT